MIVDPQDELDLPVYDTQSMTVGLADCARPWKTPRSSASAAGEPPGTTTRSAPDLHFTAVELDPAVAQIPADQFFKVRPEKNFDINIMDGRAWLTKSNDTFDLILIDAYRGPFVPFHLLTKEFYQEVAKHLRPGGVAVQNVEPSTMLFDSAVATIGSAFDNLDFYEGRGNIVIVAYNEAKRDPEELKRIAAERQEQTDSAMT